MDTAKGQFDGGNTSVEVPSSQMSMLVSSWQNLAQLFHQVLSCSLDTRSYYAGKLNLGIRENTFLLFVACNSINHSKPVISCVMSTFISSVL